MSNIKFFAIAAVQLALIAQPASAASIDLDQNASAHQRGAFAGARFKVPFGGKDAGEPAATLSLSSVQRSRGTGVSEISEGLQIGVQNEKLAFSVAGQAVETKSLGKDKAGISTLGWVGIGVGVLAVGFYGFARWVGSRSE